MEFQRIQEMLRSEASKWIQVTEAKYFHSDNIYFSMEKTEQENIDWEAYSKLSESMKIVRDCFAETMDIIQYGKWEVKFKFDTQVLAVINVYILTTDDGKRLIIPESTSQKRMQNYQIGDFETSILNKFNDMNVVRHYLIDAGVLKSADTN